MPRPRQPLLNRDRIVEVAAAHHRRRGAWTRCRRGGSRRSWACAGPSLYNHFATKDEILDAVADAVVSKVDISFFTGYDWQEALPALGPLLPSGAGSPTRTSCPTWRRVPFVAASSLRIADAVYGGLVRAGWPPARATHIGALDALLRGRIGARLVRPGFRRRPPAVRRGTTRT